MLKCQSQLGEFHSRAEALRKETSQVVARTEACNLMVEERQKENSKVLAAMEGATVGISTPPSTCIVPVPSSTDPAQRPALSSMAVISFPGGPRTVTIHPPDSPSYQPVIHDEKGDVIITFKSPKPLRREGAFRGPLEDIDWREISRVYGRGPEPAGSRAVPPVPRWPDRSQSSPCRPASRVPGEIIARQRQLSASMQTDAFGRVLTPDSLTNAKSPSPPTGTSSSESSQDSRASLSGKPEIVITPSSIPPSPSVGRGRKRTRQTEEDEGLLSPTEARKNTPLLIDVRAAKEPTTPTGKRDEPDPPEGPAKRKKPRSSASVEALPTESLVRSQSLLDVTRTF